ncbi:hypothetical protein CBS101457_004943 [Exobasidium rhododendri]|nr:hypothetical protein CBS101457_004943 [Exobasidium rhododendri]
MFYQPGVTPHNLPHDPFKACVVPRPSVHQCDVRSADGHVANKTAADRASKDTVINAENHGSFCWNLATWDLREAVNKSSEQFEYGVDEFEIAGLTKEKGNVVDVPLVKESPVKFECVYHTTLRIPGNGQMGSVDIIIGRVVGIHVSDSVLTNGLVDVSKTLPIARCGYMQYAVIRETFEMVPPGDPRMRAGLEGSAALNRTMKGGKYEEEEE